MAFLSSLVILSVGDRWTEILSNWNSFVSMNDSMAGGPGGFHLDGSLNLRSRSLYWLGAWGSEDGSSCRKKARRLRLM